MAAPTLQPLHTPQGVSMPEGYIARMVNSLVPNAPFWVISLKTGGVDGGDPIPQTTQHNVTVETQRPPHLIKAVMSEMKVAYNPDFFNKLLTSLVNKECTISEYYPDGSTKTYYGAFGKFIPDAFEIRKRPEGTLTVYETNWDASANVEAIPVYTPAVGT